MPFPLDSSTRQTIQDHFKRKKLRWEEDYFIEMLASEHKHDVYWAVIALRDCGTEKCIPTLRDKLYYPMRDVKSTALLTVAHICGSRQTPLYAEMLLDPKYPEKGYATWAIVDAADERAVGAVLEYFRKNKNKIKNGKLFNATLVEGVTYLARYHESDPDIQEFFRFLALCWMKLPEGERAELRKHVKYFADLDVKQTER